MPAKKQKNTQRITLGKLPPIYKFFLNPYQDVRFSRCPICDAKMRSRKLPFVVHVDPHLLSVLNMTARYCPNDELLILHKDKLENLLAFTVAQSAPEMLGNSYLVVGTLEHNAYAQVASGALTMGGIFGVLHDFQEYLQFEPVHYGWVNTDPPEEKPAE